ncbi:hypothetical protein H8R29_14125 [Priestia megaterium]|uniref:Group-specific protein n=1 Tax=Priestia megaterium (strain ATCC 14581 / DSM 32 / CCUG 1817 / JCM 2506 / NBRC 15308 / NCIMB 9376 / NCTC 10342 / NRRL B-14308 / VKM B-512 / Ford 19) TaxID=1348623 RepID=A0A0B6AJZ0_PRIM2|nr:hypothetical protein [Priestia megaterium]AJI25205.1 hypothetical protein BG04_5130 [Priestia megaterium NBRC 15308 = ATCC 14581]KFM96750.1 hypothetical protein DJ91_138 [Priestia megaterium]KGJ84735.1 hypothetical protein BMT_08170 [Priestia megaterium NBRC 15308 = ATCC 14581]MDR4234289.1 hypothetical protein [Priestia megaterium]MED3808938.1 hypothetical protein [Priestia megaterium]
MLEPIYAENVIVGVIHKKQFQWYVTDRELWYLDYVKFAQAFENEGDLAVDEYIEPERKGMEILSGENAELFLKRIQSYKADAATLLKLFEDKIESGEEEDVLDFIPSFLVDCDQKVFYSLFPEPASFEEYVPSDWKGTYEDFTALIPETEKYWINKDGESLFEL